MGIMKGSGLDGTDGEAPNPFLYSGLSILEVSCHFSSSQSPRGMKVMLKSISFLLKL